MWSLSSRRSSNSIYLSQNGCARKSWPQLSAPRSKSLELSDQQAHTCDRGGSRGTEGGGEHVAKGSGFARVAILVARRQCMSRSCANEGRLEQESKRGVWKC
jgi:hypothetical protein